MIRLPGYSLFRCDRVGKSEGGVAFYLADYFCAFIFCCSDGSVMDRSEFIMAEIIFNDRSKFLLAMVYRPPNSGYLNKFFQSFLDLQVGYRHSIILGVFNANMNQNTFNSQQLGSFIFESNYIYYICKLLDLCIIDDRDKLKKFGQRGIAFLSAHDLIFIRYGIKLQRRHGKLIIDIFCTKLLNIFNAHVPLRRQYFRNLPIPWLTDGIRMRDRDLARRTWRRHKNDREYYVNIFNREGKASEVWDRLRHLGLIKARDIGGRLSHSVEKLNTFFGHNAEHADYTKDGSLRDMLVRDFDDRNFHWNYVVPRNIGE
ncbi:hypothetical protein ACFW04_014617 [Cataglyphis niger]